MYKIKEIIAELEKFAPLSFQEDYDNAGLIIGSPDQVLSSALFSVDVTEEVVDEAVNKGSNLIIAHHPIIFSGLKKITGHNSVEKTVIKAIKNDIAIYASHTNLDSAIGGVNQKICSKLNLKQTKVLSPSKNQLKKLVTFIPISHADKVSQAIFDAGAGHIGNYDSCSYQAKGTGSFRALEGANPFVGNLGQVHFENEIRFETVFQKNLQHSIIKALIDNHPYQEVAYDIYPLENEFNQSGMGMIGNLEFPMDETEFLLLLKQIFNLKIVKHTQTLGRKIEKVAVCGGSGSFLLKDAIHQKADIFISGDFKYHQFFDAEKKIIIADIGHYESEQYTKELFYDILTKKFSNFAFYFSEINTNPIYYI